MVKAISPYVARYLQAAERDYASRRRHAIERWRVARTDGRSIAPSFATNKAYHCNGREPRACGRGPRAPPRIAQRDALAARLGGEVNTSSTGVSCKCVLPYSQIKKCLGGELNKPSNGVPCTTRTRSSLNHQQSECHGFGGEACAI